jgi:ABC-type bacteriocin/lantibiotic exporter with double-glycine peptidase domain
MITRFILSSENKYQPSCPRNYSICLCVIVFFALSIKELAPTSFAETHSQRVLLQVPLIKQPYMQCLNACVSMVLKYWGLEISVDFIEKHVPVYKDGTTGKDLALFVEEAGFHGFLIQPPFEDLIQHVNKERPVIVTLPVKGRLRHALVLVGFDLTSNIVWLNDPATGKCAAQSLNSFRKQWESGKRWAFLIVPKQTSAPP